MKLDQILDEIYPLSEQSKLKLKECVTEVKYPKGHILLKADKIESKIYFIKKVLPELMLIHLIAK